MASSLLALLDDIASILDDVTVMTKISVKNTAGVLGDDLALNAQQVSGLNADRELPVIWAVAKGSLVNKLILIPLALLLSVLMPWLVLPLLIFGGAFLCYEGFEKLAHKYLHSKAEETAHHAEHLKILQDKTIDIVEVEKEKIKGAIRTDFVLSAEIVAITLGEVALRPFMVRLSVLSLIGVIMTVAVYGLVAAIIKLDDAGLYLSSKEGLKKSIGRLLIGGAPIMLKVLSVVGTIAMFMVGGGIITHGISSLAGPIHYLEVQVGNILGYFVMPVMNIFIGVLVGVLALIIVTLISRVKKQLKF